jgi:hypothetical protein
MIQRRRIVPEGYVDEAVIEKLMGRLWRRGERMLTDR